MGDLTLGLVLRCSRCGAAVEHCAWCAEPLGAGTVRCRGGDDHAHGACDAQRARQRHELEPRTTARAGPPSR